MSVTAITQHQVGRLDWEHQGRPSFLSRRCERRDWVRYLAQRGGKHSDAKPLHGFHGAGILEIVEDHAGDTYRAVYTVRFAGRIYVLYVFRKKSRTRIKTPKPEIELIKSRLKRAEEEHARWLEVRKE
jgi:phage-related protein